MRGSNGPGICWHDWRHSHSAKPLAPGYCEIMRGCSMPAEPSATLLCVPRSLRFAHQMHGVAVFALGQGVMLGELDPVSRWSGVMIPPPLHKGHTLSRADRIAARMNSDRLGIPFMAARRGSSTLNVTISCFFWGYSWRLQFSCSDNDCALASTGLLLHRITVLARLVYPRRKNRLRSASMKTAQIIIPARLASTRLPRKLLLRETGKSLIHHTYEAARRSARAAGVCVATDHAEIFDEVRSFGGQVEMTRPERPQRHRSRGRGRPADGRRGDHRQRAGRRARNRRHVDRPGHRAVGIESLRP